MCVCGVCVLVCVEKCRSNMTGVCQYGARVSGEWRSLPGLYRPAELARHASPTNARAPRLCNKHGTTNSRDSQQYYIYLKLNNSVLCYIYT